ncbi:hypothetical protein V6N12_024095 [Hibiscus sabdariffa]|uniref:Uncharacterized protein n=1 Tax=Hibiscus sabdariffa TaxID=183260 RepID=A0ABR2FZK7_9ROSI
MVTDSGTWAWDRFTRLLPLDMIHRIAMLYDIYSGLGPDVVGWCAGKDGKLSVRSAYVVHRGPSVLAYDGSWKCIIKFRGLQRVKRGDNLALISILSSCFCGLAAGGEPTKLVEFLAMDIMKWVQLNLSEPQSFAIDSSNWDLLFGYVIWNLWLSCNALVFDNPLEDKGLILGRSVRLHDLSCTV